MCGCVWFLASLSVPRSHFHLLFVLDLIWFDSIRLAFSYFAIDLDFALVPSIAILFSLFFFECCCFFRLRFDVVRGWNAQFKSIKWEEIQSSNKKSNSIYTTALDTVFFFLKKIFFFFSFLRLLLVIFFFLFVCIRRCAERSQSINHSSIQPLNLFLSSSFLLDCCCCDENEIEIGEVKTNLNKKKKIPRTRAQFIHTHKYLIYT